MTFQLETELPQLHACAAPPAEAELQALPRCAAVVLLLGAGGESIQLATTQNLQRFLISRLAAPTPEAAHRADLTAVVRFIRWREVSCPFEARWRHWRVARQLFPKNYRDRIGFGPAWFLQLEMGPLVSELRLSDRPGASDAPVLGPWPTHRSATQALEGLWDLFELCRYPEQVRRSPHGRRCAYADMGRCDAPCDGAAPLPVYEARVQDAWRFACGAIEPWLNAAEQHMRTAAEAHEFERAGLIKQQMAFADRWRAEWSGRLRRFDEWRDALLLPVSRRKAWKLFVFDRGAIVDGPVISDRKLLVEAPAWIVAQSAGLAEAPDGLTRVEQTWLMAHLLYHRDGESAIVLAVSLQSGAAEYADRIQERRAAIRAAAERRPVEPVLGEDAAELPQPDSENPE